MFLSISPSHFRELILTALICWGFVLIVNLLLFFFTLKNEKEQNPATPVAKKVRMLLWGMFLAGWLGSLWIRYFPKLF